MPRQRRRPADATTAPDPVVDYRHAAKRKNIPPAGLAAQGKLRETPKVRYEYDPHLPPALRFDASGDADRLPELLATARQRALTADEAALLAAALRQHQPWLEWAGKRERRWFEVDPVALYIHERVSTQAILRLAQRAPLQRSLFADPELAYREAVQFYRHDMDWANRLILGDSLVVMSSLAKREDLAGKVQMIYLDPPYGIKFASNFQAQVGKRDVKDKDEDLTREPEQVKAYRDTWTLGVHSYLAYLRDRLLVARELLTDSGSIFVQISDENVHRVRAVMDEVFGPENFRGIVFVAKTSGYGDTVSLASVGDFLLWYARNGAQCKYRQLYLVKDDDSPFAKDYRYAESGDGRQRRNLTQDELVAPRSIGSDWRRYSLTATTSQGATKEGAFAVEFRGKPFQISGDQHWKTSRVGMTRLIGASRIHARENSLRYIRYLDDFPVIPHTNNWIDLRWGFDAGEKRYVVETNPGIVARCMLMTTDPGDLVLDPTCGSGTTAYVAEQWGRRWISIDTSRVALALARQRLLTAKFDYYALAEPARGVAGGFVYKTVPHITLKSIAQNPALDPVFARWEPVLADRLAALNAALAEVSDATRDTLRARLVAKERAEGRRAVSDADRRRWLLPVQTPPAPRTRGEAEEGSGGGSQRGEAEGGEGTELSAPPASDSPRVRGAGGVPAWQAWEVPFDSDPDWPPALRDALAEYRAAWRGKMDEVNAVIQAGAEPETLVDQPRVTASVLRVSGPFTVEGIQPAEATLDLDSPIGGAPEALDSFAPSDSPRVRGAGGGDPAADPVNAAAYLESMLRYLRQDGVLFPKNKTAAFDRLDPVSHSILHAAGTWSPSGEERRVAVSFGPQYGPVTTKQVEDCLRAAARGGYDDLVLAGFTFDAAAQAIIQDDSNPRVTCHMANIRPDVGMGDLLKTTPSSQLFTVFGLPRVTKQPTADGEWVITMEGVDIYDPITNALQSSGQDRVAAWFLDGDYDGQTFCVSQAFFPDKTAWDKIRAALKTAVDPERFAAFASATSLPFPAGPHRRAAVKVIDPRGNEAMTVVSLGETTYA